MPSENSAASVTASVDRRTRKRQERRRALLGIAADLVEQLGPDGLTMAALAEAADYAPASLYTYFPSRSALLSELQMEALSVLGGVADASIAAWDASLSGEVDHAAASLARLLAFSRLFLTAPEHHPREFRLQQRLLVTPGVESEQDAARVVPAAMAVLDAPRRLLSDAVDRGALVAHSVVADPLDQPLDGTVLRTFAWVTALNGALQVDGLITGLPTTGLVLGEHITESFLRGWGASDLSLAAALPLVAELEIPASSPTTNSEGSGS